MREASERGIKHLKGILLNRNIDSMKKPIDIWKVYVGEEIDIWKTSVREVWIIWKALDI